MKSWLERFEEESIENRLLVEKERMALEVTEALAEAMHDSGITKAELARRMDTSRSYITRIFRGHYNLSISTIVELAFRLNRKIAFSLVEADFGIKEDFSNEYVISQPLFMKDYRRNVRNDFWGRMVDRDDDKIGELDMVVNG